MKTKEIIKQKERELALKINKQDEKERFDSILNLIQQIWNKIMIISWYRCLTIISLIVNIILIYFIIK